MLSLLDLPLDVLQRIVEHLEPVSHLGEIKMRPGHTLPTHFWTCKRWLNTALPVYYSQLRKCGNRTLLLSANHLANIPSPDARSANFLYHNLEKLSIRLQGQPSKEIAMQPFFEDNLDGTDSDEQDDQLENENSSDSSLVEDKDAKY